MTGLDHGSALLDTARSLRLRIFSDRDRIEASRRVPADLSGELAGAGFFPPSKRMPQRLLWRLASPAGNK